MKMELTECSETLAFKIQALGNYPKLRIKHSEHSESFKSRINYATYRKICGSFDRLSGNGAGCF
jgi:hypothetical protein